MANIYSKYSPDPNALVRNAVDFKHVRHRVSFADHSILGGALPAAADLIFLAKLPSNAIITTPGQLYNSALTTMASIHLGLRHAKMTAAQLTAAQACLLSAVSLVAAGNRSWMTAVTIANYGKRAWEIAGLATDPGGEFDVAMLVNTAPTVAGEIYGEFTFATD